MADKKAAIKQVSDREFHIGRNRFCLDDDDIIRLTLVGDLSGEQALAFNEVVFGFFKMTEGKLSSIIDFNASRQPSLEARKIAQEMFDHERIDKVALFGLHPVAKIIAYFVMGFAKNQQMEFFKTEEAAMGWIKGQR